MKRFRPINAVIVVLMGLGSMTYGYATGNISSTLVQPTFFEYMGLATRSNATTLIGLTGSLYQAGGFFGCLSVTFFSDRWGRKVGVAVPATLSVICAALLAGSVNMEMFIVMRFLAGFAAYMLTCAIPLWMSEVVPTNVRGPLVNVAGASILCGFALSNWVGYAFYHRQNLETATWRVPIALTGIFPLILVLCLYWIPESPRWLLVNGRKDQAEQVLRRLHHQDEASFELLAIQAQADIDAELETSYISMFTKPSYRKRVVLGLLTTIGIQCCGPFIINNYGPSIYSTLGYDVDRQILYQAGLFTLAFGAGLGSILIVDLMPRNVLLGGGILSCLVCLAVEAALVATYVKPAETAGAPNTAALKAAVAMFYVFMLFFNLTLDGGQIVYLSEIFPTHLRAKGISIGISGLCLINVLWLQVAPIAFVKIGWRFYLCLIVPGTIIGTFALFWFPDTKNLLLEEVAGLFGDEVEQVSHSDVVGENEKDTMAGGGSTHQEILISTNKLEA